MEQGSRRGSEAAPQGGEDPVIGKQELLRWAASASGRPCGRFEDLRDGAVFVQLFAQVFPSVAQLETTEWCPHPSSPADARANFDVLQDCMRRVGLPPEALDRNGIARARFKPCFQLLVVLYFMYNLSIHHDFAVDFSHPVDDAVAGFLQSTASIESLRKGGALAAKQPLPTGRTRELAEPPAAAAERSQSVSSALGRSAASVDPAQLPFTQGMEVETVNMRIKPGMNGVRGRVLGPQQAPDGLRVLVDFPAPYGRMLVLPGNLAKVADDPQLPPVGQDVEACHMDTMPQLNGLRGRVLGYQEAADGVRVIVEFAPPHGALLVHPGNLMPPRTDTSSPPPAPAADCSALPPVGATVEAINMGEQPELAGAIGTVRSHKPAADGMRAHVVFAPRLGGQPQGPMLVRASSLRVLSAPGVDPALGAQDSRQTQSPEAPRGPRQPQAGDWSRHASLAQRLHFGAPPGSAAGSPPRPSSGREGLDRALIEAARLRQENELLQRELRQREERIRILEGQGGRGDGGAPTETAPEGEALWRDQRGRRKGEALVAHLRFELDQLRGQLRLAEEEAAAARRESARHADAVRLTLQQQQQRLDEHCAAQVALAEARAKESALQAQGQLAAELQRVSSQLRYESSRIRGGLAESNSDEIEEELLQLRQQRATLEPLLGAMERTNASLRDLASRHDAIAQLHRRQHHAAVARCAELILCLLPGGEGGQGAAGPLRALLGEEHLSDDDARATIAAYAREQEGLQQQHETDVGPTPPLHSNDLLAFAVKVRQLLGRLAEAQGQLQKERSRAQAPDLRTREALGTALAADYDREQALAAAEAEVARLNRTVDFLREAQEQRLLTDAARQPDHWEEELPGGIAVPSPNVPEVPAGRDGSMATRPSTSVDTICAQVHGMLRTRDIDGLERYFWLLVANQRVLQDRLTRAGDSLRRVETQQAEAAERSRVEAARAAEAARRDERARIQHSAALDLAKEKAGVEVQLRLAMEQVRELRSELHSAAAQRAQLAAAAADQADARFATLARRLRSALNSAARGRMREELLYRLADTAQERVAAGERQAAGADCADALHRLEADAEGLRQQLHQLPPLEIPEELGAGAEGSAEIESIVAEASSALREHLSGALAELRAARERAAAAGDAQRTAEGAAGAMRCQLDDALRRCAQAEDEASRCRGDLAACREELRAREAAAAGERREWQQRLTVLQREIGEAPVYEEIRALIGRSRAPPAASRSASQKPPDPHAPAPAASEAYSPPRSGGAGGPRYSPARHSPGHRPGEPPGVNAGEGAAAAAAAARDGSRDLDAAIAAARSQIVAMQQDTPRAGRAAPAAARSTSAGTAGSRLTDDDEFARQQQLLLDSYRARGLHGASARPASRGASSAAEGDTVSLPDTQR
eukprot:TRINITY_DN9945_c0_g1_i1.p1 TRINITY_DN9945_c0_g1~~TRINITY_DN9945_c0_g1_i1.p1  ORF type:complete len:1424 (+),score=493.80 TRINITY_DN9945_c0_g1_i1:77-4273(+)